MEGWGAGLFIGVTALCLGGCVASSGQMPPPVPAATALAAGTARAGSAADPALKEALAGEVRAATAAGTPGSAGYRVGPLDVLTVTVFKVPDLSKTVQVSENGQFSFPLIGEQRASGLTVSEIEKQLAARLGGEYLRNPQVTVLVSQYNSHRVTVEGAVKKPGVFPMQGPMTLLQAVVSAGGVDDISDGTLLLFRKSGVQTVAGRYSMSQLRDQKIQDPPLEPGDMIMVPQSDLKVGFKYILQALPLARLAAF